MFIKKFRMIRGEVVSEATVTSKAYLKAVEMALEN